MGAEGKVGGDAVGAQGGIAQRAGAVEESDVGDAAVRVASGSLDGHGSRGDKGGSVDGVRDGDAGRRIGRWRD